MMTRMKYALIGAPGSGKSALATAIEEHLIMGDGQCEDCNTPVEIIDGYAEETSLIGDYVIGPDGGYMANVSIAVERYNRERRAMQRAKTTITCGTVLETAVYTTTQFEKRSKNIKSDEDKIAEAQRIEATLKMFALLYMDTFKYTRTFYLPGNEPFAQEAHQTFDRNLQAAFNAFTVPVEPLIIDEPVDDLTQARLKKIFVPVEDRMAPTEFVERP